MVTFVYTQLTVNQETLLTFSAPMQLPNANNASYLAKLLEKKDRFSSIAATLVPNLVRPNSYQKTFIIYGKHYSRADFWFLFHRLIQNKALLKSSTFLISVPFLSPSGQTPSLIYPNCSLLCLISHRS